MTKPSSYRFEKGHNVGTTMSGDPDQVTALIRELLILNRAESAPAVAPLTIEEMKGRKSKRMRIRQELVQALDAHHRARAL
jgi:hypothetical protein